ncbi:pyridoxamine 5'-phosphate oxidase family protein [Dermatophilaceae bacterium Soc4.6]
MLTTVADGGALHRTPMTTQQAQFDGDAWFLVGRTSPTTTRLSTGRARARSAPRGG